MANGKFGIAVVVALMVGGGSVLAQEGESAPGESVLERYLEERGLTELLTVHLLERLKAADAAQRLKLADRLGSLYVQMLDRSASAPQRHLWEQRSQELLRSVPEADSFELRLNLAKARYLLAEESAEKHRLRLTTPEEKAEAETTLRQVGATFSDIGAKLSRRVDALERREASGRDEDVVAIREELAEARRLRSLAMYYSGWSSYYSAFLAGRAQVDDAMVAFGYLLNASNRQANVERIPENLLQYDHVARAAIGCALCETQRGRDGAAILWLDALERVENLPDSVRQQLFARRLYVMGMGKRWGDLGYLIQRRRQPSRPEGAKPLAVSEARLLAVLTMEALEDGGTQERARPILQELADAAITDLISRGEVKHVQDLVSRYGSTTLGGDGFIVQYVRGMQAYERARAAHGEAGGDLEQPTAMEPVANLYRRAADSFKVALKAEDAERYAEERTNAGLLWGLSHYYAGDLVQAADLFEQAHLTSSAERPKEDALWLAIVALDKADRPSLQPRLTRLSTLYLQSYPKSERAAKLLLRQAASGLISEEQALEILLGVERSSAVYEAARRQAASILYGVYRRARGADKDFAALRFAEVSEELLRIDRGKVAEAIAAGNEAEAKQATEQIIIRVRQVLDAVLGMTAPDLARAEKAFEVLDAISLQAGVSFQQVEDELTYRRLQLALARNQSDEVERSLDRLRALGGRFADAADRLMFRRAQRLLAASPHSAAAAAEVVRHGLRVIEQFGKDESALSDPAVHNLYASVADAAAIAWYGKQDELMRDIALKLDGRLLEHGNPPASVLRRYAQLSESADDVEGALEAWRVLLAGLSRTDPAWFEARFQSLRLLAAHEPGRAREAMAQHKVLNPEYGPEPWGEMLRDLDMQLGGTGEPKP
jgi:hypothetical protein